MKKVTRARKQGILRGVAVGEKSTSNDFSVNSHTQGLQSLDETSVNIKQDKEVKFCNQKKATMRKCTS